MRRQALGATSGKRPRLRWLVRLFPLSLPVLVESGRVEDSLHFGPTDSQSRASLCCGGGTYTVRVRKEGFAPWTVDGLEAESDHCGHTKGVVARAYLRRL